MKHARVLVIAGVLARASALHAGPLVTPPVGWQADPDQARTLAVKVSALGHFGGPAAATLTEAYRPAQPGVMLFVTRALATVTRDRDAAARAEVDELHATSRRATLAGSGMQEDAWQERVDPKTHLIVASLSWRDPAAHTLEHARLVIAGDTEHLASITGECFARDDADRGALAACLAALATIDPGIELGARVAIALAPAGTTPPAPEPLPGAGAQAHMDDGSHTPLPPITIPQARPASDRRPVYVGFGVVILAAVFWWNRRRRARFDREDDAPQEPHDR